ncbi:hypothetical protein QCA50_000480 [Cerrena zonata]|uniref:Protein kinase domain-containing protein n=1 Tax=Cerrena zonata TaxID=2478898 RepID=A0AAW0GT41_9APHY
MQPAQGWTKRHFDADDDEDYYRKSPPRTSYEMRGDGSSSQNRRGADEWRRVGEDHYSWSPSKDKQRRGARDDYDPSAGTPSKDPDYSQRQWKGPHETDFAFHDNSGWVPRTTDTSRDISYNQWSPREERGGPQEQRGRSRWDARERPRDSGWNRNNINTAAATPTPTNNANNNKKDPTPKEFQSDNGWASRRRANDDRPQSDDTTAKPFVQGDDRAWEPAASWRSVHKDSGVGGNPANNPNNSNPNNHRQGKQGQRKHQNRNKGSKNKKQNQGGQQKPKQDWRNDDSNPNNWTRRDGPSSANKNAMPSRGRKPQPRTPSRSRSRSRSRSNDSYYSRRSSPRRSQSPNYGHGRRRSPSYTRSYGRRSPSPDGRRGWVNDRRGRHSRSPSSSPRSPRNYRSSPLPRRSSPGRRSSPPPRRWGRRRSPSSASSFRSRSRSRSRTPSRSRTRSRTRSMSRSRSRSRSPSISPRDRPRPVHRLPTASSVNDVNAPTPTGKNALPRPPGLPMRPEAAPHPQKNGKANKRKKKQNRNAGNHNHNSHNNHFDMPPPHLPGPSNQSWEPPMASSMSHVSTSPQSQKSEVLPGPSRFAPVKAAGFKPIGQASSAVKRFFPGDDDDSGPDPLREPPTATSSKSPHHAPHIPPHIPPREVLPLPSHYPHHPYPEPTVWNPEGFELPEPIEREAVPYEDAQMPASASFSPPPPERRPSDYDNRIPRPQSVNDAHLLGHHVAEMRVQESQTLTPADTRPPSPQGSKAELYIFIAQVGEGTFGKVFKARNRDTGRYVALKRIRMEGERDGFPVTAMREIKLLQSLRHNNIVRLHEMVVCQGEFHMVFEYMDHDLTGILSQSQFSFTDAHLKSLCQQMLAGLAYLHHKGVVHRDIKGSNILLNNRGELKLADFGLARFYQKRRRSDYTNRVITLWYRPPELLFGTTVYGPEVDMWSAGCIMLELFTKKPVFQGNDEIHQLDVIYKLLGTPTSERWPEVSSLPWYELVKPKDHIQNRFRDLFQKWLSPAGLDLAEHLLTFNPALRATAVQALEANYFKQELPPPELPVGLATLEGEWHELETKRERAKKRRRTEAPAPSGTQ